MPTLEDFNYNAEEQTPPSLDDINALERDVNGLRVTYPDPSNLNRAAKAALLSGDFDNLKTNYSQMVSELRQYGDSQTERSILDPVKKSQKKALDNTVFGVLSNPNVTDEQKKNLVQNYDKIAEFNLNRALAEKSLIDDAGEVTQESQQVRVGLGDMLDQIVVENEEVQKAVNGIVTQMDAGNAETFAEFVETVVPFTEMNQIRRISKEFFGEEKSPNFLSMIFVGSRKQQIREELAKLPADKRLAATQSLIQIIKSNDGILLQGDNDYATYAQLQQLVEGEYTNTDKWIDNVTAVFDLIGAGQLVKKGVKTTTTLYKAAQKEVLRGGAQPTSAARIVQDTNRAKAEDIHTAAMLDETDETAKAMYGTDKEGVAADYAHELPADDGSVRSRIHDIGASLDAAGNVVNEDAVRFFQRGGDTFFTPQEKAAMRQDVLDQFENLATNPISDTVGLTHRSEMMTVDRTPTGVNISSIFGPRDGGFLKPQEAIDHVKFNLRELGVKDSDITLMQRRGSRYYPMEATDKEAVLKFGAQGDYLVKVNYDYAFNPLDVAEWMKTSTTYNIFDRIPFLTKMGVQRAVMDPASMIDPLISTSASAAVERTAGLEHNLLELGKKFTDDFIKFDPERQTKLYDFIKYNNKNNVAPTLSRMRAEGFTDDEIGAMYKWKEYWDTIYHLENKDLSIKLRNEGWQMIEDAKTSTRLVVKPQAREAVGNMVQAYDPVSNKVILLRKPELDDLYARGGGLNKLKTPSDFGSGDTVEHVITNNQATGLYPRGIRETDSLLNYRDGYFHVDYNAPFFIREERVTKEGKKYVRAVAVAGDVQEAKHLVARYNTQSSGSTRYFFDENRKGRIEVGDDDYWGVISHGGRSAQRARGKRLEGADVSDSISNGKDYILSPVDSMIKSAKSISSRVGMRKFLDTSKERFMAQYGHLVEKRAGEFKPSFPQNIEQLKKRNGTQSDKDLADARTNWEYITTLEHGFRNSVDDGIKASMKTIADMLGNKGLTKAEKAMRKASEGRGLSKFSKGIAFEVYLVTNPLRQFFVQSHQATLLAANFGNYGTGSHLKLPYNMGKLAKDSVALTLLQMAPDRLSEAARIAGKTEKEMKKLFDDYNYSGLGSGVSRSSLINDSLSELAEAASYNRNKSLNKKARLIMQKAGFEVGERLNITSAWLAYRDRALRAGIGLNDEVLDKITAAARNYTYNMNAAGEMSYNQNSLSVLFQFFQVPHKAALQLLTNRQLTKTEKLKLGTYQLLMYGLPASFVYDWLGDSLPEDPDLREKLVTGLEGATLNTLMSAAFDEDVKIDYKSLAPVDLLGTYAFVEGLMHADISQMVASSPSGQMLMGSNPRMVNLAKTVGRYFGGFFNDYREPTTYSMVANEFLSTFSSGYSNAFKARMAMAYERKMNGFGDITDKNVGSVEGFMMALGFRTVDERNAAYRNDISYQKSKEWKADMQQYYKDITHHLAMQGVSPKDTEFQARVLNMAWDFFPANNLKERDEIIKLMHQDMNRGNDIIADILRIAEMDGGISEARAMLRSLNDEQLNKQSRENLEKFLSELEAQNEILKEGSK